MLYLLFIYFFICLYQFMYLCYIIINYVFIYLHKALT